VKAAQVSGKTLDGPRHWSIDVNDRIALIATLSVIVIILMSAFLLRRFIPHSPARQIGSAEGFARLLVAEIRMYHGKAVDQAFEESAIYRRLGKDIDRSRQMFLERFPGSEAAFYSALVAVLARGQGDRLGADYPHPRKVG